MMLHASLNEFDADIGRKLLRAPTEMFAGRMPEALEIVSHHTGRVMRFQRDLVAAEAAEYWDGAEVHYVGEDGWRAVLYHAY